MAQRSQQQKASYLWIAEPEIQTSKVSEKAEPSEENPVLQSRNTRENGSKSNNKQIRWMESDVKKESTVIQQFSEAAWRHSSALGKLKCR